VVSLLSDGIRPGNGGWLTRVGIWRENVCVLSDDECVCVVDSRQLHVLPRLQDHCVRAGHRPVNILKAVQPA
jgi:hypothetical protein